MSEIFEQLGIKPGVMAVNAAGFLLLLWLLRRFAYEPLRQMLAQREQEVQHNLDEAQHQREAAERDKRTLGAEMAKLDQKAQEMIARATEEGGQQRARIIEEARRESERLSAEGRRQVEHAADEARERLRAEAAGLAVEISARALRQSMDQERQAALLDAFIEDLQEMGAEEGSDQC
jgi:F-type H+-transporting ATPase subunit b